MDQEESRKRSFEKDERKSESPRKKRGSPKKVPRKFGDLSEEDVLQMGLPDLFEKDLDIVFVRKSYAILKQIPNAYSTVESSLLL
eukprot:m.45268 g.45268  ORF g.45268 m.45268 type:complete len:85 (+) comp33578_c0_seq7:123-377(+)